MTSTRRPTCLRPLISAKPIKQFHLDRFRTGPSAMRDFAVSATATSNLAVSFTATGSCAVTGSTVHLTGAGSCTITAHQGRR